MEGVKPALMSSSHFTLNRIFSEMPDDILSSSAVHVSLWPFLLEPSEEGTSAHAAQKPLIISMASCRQNHSPSLQQILTWNKN